MKQKISSPNRLLLLFCLLLIFFSTSLMNMGCTPVKSGESAEMVPYTREDLKRRTFDYFWELADSTNFQVPDRYPSRTFSSIAATGFGLSSYIVGIENEYITRDEGARRVEKTLRTLWNLPQGADSIGVSGYQGFFYHFLTFDKAERYKTVELSSIDTGLLMAGVLSCMSYFDGQDSLETQIRTLSDSLYQRVNWEWMMKENGKMSMGWHPEKGFIASDWSGYNEAMVLIIMAMGSPTYPIHDESWNKWAETYTTDTFYGSNFLQFEPLFGHQYSHIWVDFRGIKDAYCEQQNSDYFINSQKATLANRAHCIANALEFENYGENEWGLTACDGPYDGTLTIDGKERFFRSYSARGASSERIIDDGTIAPTAAGGSFAFTPKESEAALKHMWEKYNTELIDEYGFKDAFNLTFKNEKHPKGWFDTDYLGIDQGPILLMIENHESELIWNIMKKNPYILKGLERAGFKGGWLENEL